jgi:hypothetical protein
MNYQFFLAATQPVRQCEGRKEIRMTTHVGGEHGAQHLVIFKRDS